MQPNSEALLRLYNLCPFLGSIIFNLLWVKAKAQPLLSLSLSLILNNIYVLTPQD
jgi:hypothetical protein